MKLSTYFVFLFSLLFLTAVSSVAQTGKEQKPSSKKMSSKLFGRSVLFPETITVRADGTPVFVASNDGLEISVAAFRGANYLYFQVEFENSSDKPYLFSALDFSMTDDRGFKVRGIDINYVREDLAGSARGPAPPPPAPQVSTTTINTTTTGTVDPYGNVNARTTGQATTRTGPDPYYQAGYALGSLLSRGSRKTEQSFVEDLSAFGVNYSTIGPGEKQRVYIAFAMVKSKSVTLSFPQEFNSRVTFNWKKPKS